MVPSPKSVTQLLIEWRDGDETALDHLVPIVHEELRRLAHSYMRKERKGHTLQTSALINEAYIRLVDHKGMRWQNRKHFYAVAAQAMRRVLVDYARARRSVKRGGDLEIVQLDEVATVAQKQATNLIALDDALTDLAHLDQRKSQIVEMQHFGGMEIEEIAAALEVSTATVNRDLKTAKLWLLQAMSPQAPCEKSSDGAIDAKPKIRLKS